MTGFLQKPVGIFDSGIGGLTVLNALRATLPGRNFVYLGDTARLPYGTKSRETVRRYATGMTAELLERDIAALVIACNTASAFAQNAITDMAGPDIPVTGMITPAARAAAKATRTGHILVIGTQSTINSQAYRRAIALEDPDLRVSAVPAQLLVALAEEGWHRTGIAKSVIATYLQDCLQTYPQDMPDTLIMGCTHFPVFADTFRAILGPYTSLINCGEEAAKTIQDSLPPAAAGAGSDARDTRPHFLLTDTPDRFLETARIFYDGDLDAEDIEMIDITV